MPTRSPTSRKYRSASWWRRIGAVASAVAPASAGSGVVVAYWWASGCSGIACPAIDDGLLDRYFDQFVRGGFLEAAPAARVHA